MKYDLPSAIRKLIGDGGANSVPVNVTLVADVLHAFFPDKTNSELSEAVAEILRQEGRAMTWEVRDQKFHDPEQ